MKSRRRTLRDSITPLMYFPNGIDIPLEKSSDMSSYEVSAQTPTSNNKLSIIQSNVDDSLFKDLTQNDGSSSFNSKTTSEKESPTTKRIKKFAGIGKRANDSKARIVPRKSMRQKMSVLKYRFTVDYIFSKMSSQSLQIIFLKFLEKQKQAEDARERNKFKRSKNNSDLQDQEEQEGFTLIEFIKLMKEVISYDPDDEQDLVHGLTVLFEEIDINGDGTMEWEEFSSHIVQACDDGQITAQIKSYSGATAQQIQEYFLAEEQKPAYLHTSNILQAAQAKKVEPFSESILFKDLNPTNQDISKALLDRKSDSIIVYAEKATSIRVIEAMSTQGLNGSNAPAHTRLKQEFSLPLHQQGFVLDIALNEQDSIIALASTDSKIYFYRVLTQTQKYKLFKIFCGCGISCQVKLWYLEKHGVWCSSSSKNKLRFWIVPKQRAIPKDDPICEACTKTWLQNNQRRRVMSNDLIHTERLYDPKTSKAGEKTSKYLKAGFNDLSHPQAISDVIEMSHPFKAVLTSCHDGKIRIFSFELQKQIGVLEASSSIRQLDYTPYFGGGLLAVGCQLQVNLWEIDSSLSFGKTNQDQLKELNMISAPVVGARFLAETQFIVAVDENNTVKVFNFKQYTCFQTIQSTSMSKPHAFGLIVFSHNKFATFGKRFTFYDNLSKQEQTTNIERVSRKQQQIRRMILKERGLNEMVYAAKLQKNAAVFPAIDAVFNEYYKTFFVMSKDSMRIYEAKDGRLSKYLDNLNEATGVGELRETRDLTSFCLDEKHRVLYVGDTVGTIRVFNCNSGVVITKFDIQPETQKKKTENKEVCSVKFYHENGVNMLVSAQWNETISAWNTESVEQAECYRTMQQGLHLRLEVKAMAISTHHSLIATGTQSGVLALYDFETFKLVSVFTGNNEEIVSINFTDAYPLLISCGLGGIVGVFTIRSAPFATKNQCIARFVNLGFNGKDWINVGVTSAFVKLYSNGLRRSFAEDEHKLHDLKKTAKTKTFFKTEVTEQKPEPEPGLMHQPFSELGNPFAQTFKMTFSSSFEEKEPEEGTFQNILFQEWQEKFQPPEERFIDTKMTLVLGDESGDIKYLDLSVFINNRQPNRVLYEEVPCYSTTKLGFYPYRRFNIDGQNHAKALFDQSNRQEKIPILDSMRCVQVKVLESAHKGRINSVRKIDCEPFGFITTGNDKHVKIWSDSGELMGDINLLHETTKLKKWNFKYNWNKHQDRTQQKVQALMIELEKREHLSSIQSSSGQSSDSEVFDLSQTQRLIALDRRSSLISTSDHMKNLGKVMQKLLIDKINDDKDKPDNFGEKILNTTTAEEKLLQIQHKREQSKNSQIKETLPATANDSSLRPESKWSIDEMFPIPPPLETKTTLLSSAMEKFNNAQTLNHSKTYTRIPVLPSASQKRSIPTTATASSRTTLTKNSRKSSHLQVGKLNLRNTEKVNTRRSSMSTSNHERRSSVRLKTGNVTLKSLVNTVNLAQALDVDNEFKRMKDVCRQNQRRIEDLLLKQQSKIIGRDLNKLTGSTSSPFLNLPLPTTLNSDTETQQTPLASTRGLKFKRQVVIGLNSQRNMNAKFLSKLEKFVHVDRTSSQNERPRMSKTSLGTRSVPQFSQPTLSSHNRTSASGRQTAKLASFREIGDLKHNISELFKNFSAEEPDVQPAILLKNELEINYPNLSAVAVVKEKMI